MKIAFYFRSGAAVGMGHASRCLALADEFRSRHGATIYLNRPDLRRLKPDVIVIDVNYLSPAAVKRFRRLAPVINLAPRGLPKYYATASFLDLPLHDVPRPKDAPEHRLFAGPRYAVLGKSFRRKKRAAGKGVVVAMGGVDGADLTGKALKALRGLDPFVELHVITGAKYPHRRSLKTLAESLPNKVTLMSGPRDMARALSLGELGVFAAGVTGYEALSLGIPGVHVSLTSFHRLRVKALAARGLGFDGGMAADLREGGLARKVAALLGDKKRLARLRGKARKAVDGYGARRIAAETMRLLKRSYSKMGRL